MAFWSALAPSRLFRALPKNPFSIKEKELPKNRIWQTLVFILFAIALPVLMSVITISIEPNYACLREAVANDWTSCNQVVGNNAIAVTSAAKTLTLIYALLLYIGFPVLGFLVQLCFGLRQFFVTGQFFFYLYWIVPGVLRLLGVASNVNDWLIPVFRLALLGGALFLISALRSSLFYLLKFKTLLVIAISAAVLYGMTYGLNIAGSAAAPGASVNQASVDKQSLGVSLFSGVLVAPFVEEYLLRRTVLFSFNRSVIGTIFGSVFACFYFAFIHIDVAIEWDKFIQYFLPSLSLTLGLVVFKNAMPSAIAHTLNNLTVFLVN